MLIANNITMQFGAKPLFENVSVKFGDGNRYGLIGANGCGKSTFMKILAGVLEPTAGNISLDSNERMAFLRQDQFAYEDQRVIDVVMMGHEQMWKANVEKNEIYMNPEATEEDYMRAAELEGVYAEYDGYTAEARAGELLLGVGIPIEQHTGPMSAVAPGWKLRVLLVQALFANPDILLLDEPTNHLDFAAIEWLEELLLGFQGSVLFITHDRRFLDRLATRIVELDRGHLTDFIGNYTQYLVKKEELLAVEATHAAKFDKVLAQEEAWIRQGIKARRTRNEGRVRRLEQLRLERAARRERQGNVKLTLDSGERSGKLVAELEHVNKAYGDKVLVKDFSTRILRGDRIGLLGPNGAGKSTLLKMILGELEPDSGTIQRGTNLNVAYFDQMREQLDEEATLADTISPGSEFVQIGNERKHVISYLEDFLFPPQRSRSPVKSLSGGERNRLLLARLFARPANVLVLDEPTNDLDIDTLELLENLLQEFEGTLFLVSHDRAFLENTVTQVIAFEGDGVLDEFGGGYDDWYRYKQQQAANLAAEKTRAASAPAPAKPAAAKPAANRLSFKENRELEELPGRIEQLEKEQAEINVSLASPDLYRENPEQVKTLQARLDELASAIDAAMQRWEELESKR